MLVVLGPRTIEGLRLRYYYWLVAALVVALFTLVIVGGVSLFFGAGVTAESISSLHPSAPPASSALAASTAVSGLLDSDANNDGQVDGIADSLVVSGRPIRGQLDNDLDNDNNPDGIADPLVGLVLVFLLVPSVGASLLVLSLYKLPMVGCDYYLPLERPG